LKDAGFTPNELKQADYTDGDLTRAGIVIKNENNDTLKAAGFGGDEIKTPATKAAPEKETIATANIPEQKEILGRLSKAQMENMTSQELDDFLKQQQAMMRQQANDLITAWTQIPNQQYVIGETPPAPNIANLGTTPQSSAAIALQNVDVYKAGTIIFATLDSEVNSDENTPVMATVIQGQLKGSKLLGNLQRVDKKVLLQFSVLSVPKLNNSIAINAVAIDPNTAKTALASNVDNHYMLRYGTLLATSFAGGLADAMQTSGSQTTATTNGTLSTFPKISFTQQLAVALGKMGQQVGAAMGTNINMPPTVKVNAGTSIGLLLITDLSVPKISNKEAT
jgi:intracellular multiplication protein IcmE